MTTESKLAELRERIDAVDEKLLKLISERAGIAREVAEVKKQFEDEPDFYRPEREAQILSNIMNANEGPLSSKELARLFREIMSACLALEQRLNIAYLGPEGTFTETAALKHFGHSVKKVASSSIDQVFREVEAENCSYGVVPVENSIEGMVNHTLDMLMNSELQICGEVELRIHQNLLAKNSDLKIINKIYSHQQSLAQCRAWLDENLPGVERVALSSNAEAASRASQEDGVASIGGVSAAEHYDLQILANNIEDESDNTTRFLVLGREEIPVSGNDKTSILFSMPSKPGSLLKMLACFADNKVNMTRIESRPSRRGMWEYIFFVDVDGHQQEDAVAKAILQLREEAAMVRILGSYPKAVL